MRVLNLHIRLTTACNARCAYCSCDCDLPSDRMSLDNLEASINFVLERVTSKDFCHIEILGGEVLILPIDYLRSSVNVIKEVVKKSIPKISIGCQTNLIASKRKIKELHNIFGPAIGTSQPTKHRTVNGLSDAYHEIYTQSARQLQKLTNETPGTVIVFDKNNVRQMPMEYESAEKQQRRITIRPVYQGRHSVETVDPAEYGKMAVRVINKWFCNGSIVVDPFIRMTKHMLGLSPQVGCPFWKTCAGDSLNIEPNGDIYLCQDMADANVGKIGNTLMQSWDQNMFLTLSKRRVNLHNDCQQCQYLEYCQGGCMTESKTESNDFYAKPLACESHKLIFQALSDNIDKYGKQASIDWINKLETFPINNETTALEVCNE